MKVNKFDYNKGVELILDTIEEWEGSNEVTTSSFQNSYDDDLEWGVDFLNKKLKEKGFDLFDFIKKHENEVFNDPVFIEANGFMDTILYTYDNDKGIIGGIRMNEMDDGEIFIKYMYGYHNYNMGKKYLLQSYDTLDDYFEDTANKIIRAYFNENWGFLKEEDVNKISLVKKYGNTYVTFCDLRLLYNMENIKQKYDSFMNDVKRDFNNIHHDIYDNMLIIYVGKSIPNIPQSDIDNIKYDLEVKYQAGKYNL